MTARADQVVLASHNRGKLDELRHLFAAMNRELIALPDRSSVVPEETAVTFVENALIKARHAARVTGLPALADDSGLCVRALDGAPGVRSARYAGVQEGDGATIDLANNRQLLRALADQRDRSAHFCCVLVYLRAPDDPEPLIAQGHWHGEILEAARGANGFGYDPLFLDPELGASSAELSREAKNRVSHRARAAAQLAQLLATRS